MKAFFAIARLTWKQALRSKFFLILVGLLIIWSCSIPFVIVETRPEDFFRVMLLYSLSGVTFLLGGGAIWLGCYTLTADQENYQLHLVVTKPVSRITIFFGKWAGVASLCYVLLIGAAAAIFALIHWRISGSDFTEAEKLRIRNEVMVGRRAYLPQPVDTEKRAAEIVREKLTALGSQADGSSVDMLWDSARQQANAEAARVPYRRPKIWVYDHIPATAQGPYFLRYRLYVNKISDDDQRKTKLYWQLGVPQLTASETPGQEITENRGAYQINFYPLTEVPEELLSGIFVERSLPGSWPPPAPDGKVFLALVNFDEHKADQYLQPGDGPKLLIRVTGFGANFSRAVLVIAIALGVLSGLGCAFGAAVSLPTAVFLACAYLLLGTIASFMVDGVKVVIDADWGHRFAQILLWGIIPLQHFDATELLATGELVEWSLIWGIFWRYFLCRTLPLALLGMVIYRRRELALVRKK